MTDDIVTRLREKYLGQLPICTEAAEEIERLRKVIVAVAIDGRVSRHRVRTLLEWHGCTTTLGEDQ